MDDLRAALGHRVRELRERIGLSQEQLAERADLHWTYISGVERGRRNPGLNTLGRLARALKTTLPALVTDLRPQMKVKVRRGRPPKNKAHRCRDLERGRQTPTLDVVNRVACGLGVTLAEFFNPFDQQYRLRFRKCRRDH